MHQSGLAARPRSCPIRLANLALQGYISEVEPGLEDVLLTVVRVVWRATGSSWQFSELTGMGRAVAGDGANYVWFQFGLQALTKRLWENAGVTALRRLVDLLHGSAPTQDEALAMIETLDPGVAADLRHWPAFAAN